MAEWIYIAGMHRSGTSASARVLNLLGASLGNEDRLMPAAEDNPRGFWESVDVTRTNERLLGMFNGSWDRPPVLEDGWEAQPTMQLWREEIAKVLGADTHADARLHAVKDPRLSLLLPLWESVQPSKRVILPLREPAAVCQSLLRRNETPVERGAYLWLRYVTETLKNAESPLPIVYRALMEDPDAVCGVLCAELDLPAPGDQARTEVRDFLDRKLDHESSGDDFPGSPLLDLAQDVYSSLSSGVMDPPAVGAVADLVRLLGEDLDPMRDARDDAAAAALETARLTQRLEEINALRLHLKERLGKSETRVRVLNRDNKALRAAQDDLQNQLETARHLASALALDLEEARAGRPRGTP